ncbi:MAG: hypothetical protein HRT70_07665 [Flavobacteriaceae bacterium]|nr:hypothetical protein [Flavobacteriaceae bacterium]
MSKYINEDTRVTLDLKTIGIVIAGATSLVALYFALQSDIEKAKELPVPDVQRVEFELKDNLVRSNIDATQKDIEEIKEDLKIIKQRVYELKTERNE